MRSLIALSILWSLCHGQELAPTLRGSAVDAVSSPSLDDPIDIDTIESPTADLPYLLERQGRRHLQLGGMQPLSCNDSYDPCVTWSSLFGTSNRVTGVITIPCGQCVRMDHAGDTLTLPAGIDIQGKLVFPNNYRGLTLTTSMIVVQGELEMLYGGRITDTPAIKIVMIGDAERSFVPIGENTRYCGVLRCTVGKKAITVAGGRANIRGVPGGTTTWTKLYDVVGTGQTTTGIVVPLDGVLNRWGVGAEILITSHSNQGDQEQVRRIVSFDTEYFRTGFMRLFLDAPITRPTTTRDNPVFAVEVALLSRHIVFEGGPDSTSFHGGHFWIFETSAHRQRVQGVEFVNFGQAGELGRYPLHAHLCGDLSGSEFSRNTIRDSNQRCIVVHATDNLLVEENVAYNTGGHCFILEDGMETGNEFIRNLGARTHPPGRIIPNMGTNGAETDGEATTFWIPSLGNTWVDNVAAGCTDGGTGFGCNGWWFEPLMRGPLAENYADWSPGEINFQLFEGNTAHSNGIGMKTYPLLGLRPPASSPNHIVDFKTYRNQFIGLFAFFATNLVVEGGVFADTSINLEIDQSLNVIVYDVDIIGESDIYTEQIAAQGMRQPCLNGRTVGLQLHTNAGRTGVTVQSASFSGFEDSRCLNEFAARLDGNEMSTDGIPEIGDGGDLVTGGGGGDGGAGSVHALGDLPDGLFVNCGGPGGVGGGIMWEADEYFLNGEAVEMRPDRPTLYTQFREQSGDSLDYRIPVNDGSYRVDLYWVEYEYSGPNLREFDVYISGNEGPVLEDFDVVETTGRRLRLARRRFTATVTNDEELQISLVGTTDNAFLTLFSVQAVIV